MPNKLFKAQATDMAPCFDSVVALARTFDVSLTTVIRRLSNRQSAVWTVGRTTWKLENNKDLIRTTGLSSVFPRQVSKSSRQYFTWVFSEAFPAAESELKKDAKGSRWLTEQLIANRYVVVGTRKADVTVWCAYSQQRFQNSKEIFGAIFN